MSHAKWTEFEAGRRSQVVPSWRSDAPIFALMVVACALVVLALALGGR